MVRVRIKVRVRVIDLGLQIVAYKLLEKATKYGLIT